MVPIQSTAVDLNLNQLLDFNLTDYFTSFACTTLKAGRFVTPAIYSAPSDPHISVKTKKDSIRDSYSNSIGSSLLPCCLLSPPLP